MPHWPAVAQVFQLERHVVRRQRTTVEFTYGLTSLPATSAPPPRLLQLVRHHWHIENRLHWRRDTRLGEDACRVRSGRAPYTLAALNNAVLAFMDYLGVQNVADQFRIFAAQPHTALNLLLCPLSLLRSPGSLASMVVLYHLWILPQEMCDGRRRLVTLKILLSTA